MMGHVLYSARPAALDRNGERETAGSPAVRVEQGASRVTDTMRAVVKAVPGPGFEMQRVPIPRPGPEDVLVRVRAASICGTDLHLFRWDPWAAGHGSQRNR